MAKLVLAKALKRKKVSKRQFAKRLGVPYDNVFRFFRPGRNPTLKTLNKWASVLGVRVRDLLEE